MSMCIVRALSRMTLPIDGNMFRFHFETAVNIGSAETELLQWCLSFNEVSENQVQRIEGNCKNLAD